MQSANRDEKGRFIKGNSYRFTDKVLAAYKEGFIAGLNAQSGMLLPSKKLQIFLSQKGYN